MTVPLSPSFDPIAFHARFRPNVAACIDLTSGERLDYRTLAARVAQCVSALASMVSDLSGARIAVVARNCTDIAVLTLACERTGAILVPLNWRLAAPELAGLFDDCSPAIVLVQAEFDELVETASSLAKQRAVKRPLSDLGAQAQSAPTGVSPGEMNAPCIILYTSGTTGRPKGVVITRDNALYSSLNFAALAKLDARSVLLCDAPMFHTVGLVAITRTAMLQGACVVISDRFVPSVTLQRLSDPALGVTHYFVVPQMVEALMREPGAARADFSRLTALFSGGGPLSPALVKACIDRSVLLVNGYGMSEMGSGIHMPLDAAYMAANTHAVGFPAPYLDVMLANAQGEAVAPGEVGEIWMRGPSVSPGYWNQPEATAASQSGDWFRSGDLARQQSDGAFVIVDRLKDMYISGGENVYPAEVEAVLRLCAGVEDAAVAGVPDARWGEVGAAFVQLTPGANLSPEDIREHCATRLARYKQPAHVKFVDALPRTGSGKVLKNRLLEGFHSKV
ncbi:MAG TPA: AMP-binding protein [Hyphomonadaceae bacterium]|nr:AMP-binding protein [Hyphomonadaceae bacterium]